MELEHLAASPFLFLMRLVQGAFILLFLGAWTLGVFGYKLIGGGDVLTRAKAAMTLLGARPYTFDFTNNTSRTEDIYGSWGYQAHAPICSVTAWSFNTEADTGTARQSAKLAIAYQNASVMSAAMRRMFMIVKEDATYATNDGLYLTNLCDPGPDNTIVLKHAPVVEMRYDKGVIAGACLKGHCNYGSDDEQSNWSSWLPEAREAIRRACAAEGRLQSQPAPSRRSV
jgi:hypothetical protein